MVIQIYVKLLIETLNWLLKINFVKNNMHSELRKYFTDTIF